mmetsp:Transcript_26705/g.62734  ORF Transcript_26705/g.62734 Transcript_26705/m.62734 type:complete len:95 (+) Transcript_26705:2065-2349(+)
MHLHNEAAFVLISFDNLCFLWQNYPMATSLAREDPVQCNLFQWNGIQLQEYFRRTSCKYHIRNQGSIIQNIIKPKQNFIKSEISQHKLIAKMVK